MGDQFDREGKAPAQAHDARGLRDVAGAFLSRETAEECDGVFLRQDVERDRQRLRDTGQMSTAGDDRQGR